MPKNPQSTSNPNLGTSRGNARDEAAVGSLLGLMSKGSGDKNWLKYRSPEHKKNAHKYEYVYDHIEGLVLDDDKIEKYLIARSQGESTDAYAERVRLAQFSPHLARAITSLAGMTWANQKDEARTYSKEDDGEGLGDPSAPDSILHKLWEDADGKGMNWRTLFQRATLKAIGYSTLSFLVEGPETVTSEDGKKQTIREATIKLIDPQYIPRKIYSKESGSLIGVMLMEMVDLSDSFMEEPNPELHYRIYEVNGYQVWRINEKKDIPEVVTPFTPYSQAGFTWKTESGIPVPPVFTVDLSLPANLGYIQARRANSLFNQENTLEFLLWIACFPKLFADVINREDGAFDEQLWSEIKKQLKAGSNLVPGAGSKFAAPPMEPAQVKHEVIKEFRSDFYTTFFLDMGDKAKEQTATEIAREERSGVEAILALITRFADEFENQAFYAIEQVYFPDQPDLWGGTRVTRSTDFSGVDIEDRIDRLVRRHVPGGYLPIDPETIAQLAITSLRENGYPLDEEGEKALIELAKTGLEREAQFKAQAEEFGVVV